MANTLTDLIPDLYAALDTVSRELVGFIPAATLDANASRAALGQTVRSPVTPAVTATDINPNVTPPNDGDQTIGNRAITITKARRVPVKWTGEESRGINAGPGLNPVLQQQFAQAMRTLTNEIEADMAALYKQASIAYGAPGTTPFASSVADSAHLLKILLDNGAPVSDLQLVIDTTAGAALRSLQQLTKVNEAGDDSLVRQGVLLDLHGFVIRESAQIKPHVKGTGTGWLVNNPAGFSVGDTLIDVDSGTGTILAGDVITFVNDPNKYVVAKDLTAGVLEIAAPGLKQDLADNAAITVADDFVPSVGFSRSAMILAARAPALPQGGDSADDNMVISDPRSGLSFEVSLYRQYKQIQYEVAIAWGVANIKPEHTALLLG